MTNVSQSEIDRQIAIEDKFAAEGKERSRQAIIEALAVGNVGQVNGMKKILNTIIPAVEAEIDALKATKCSGVGARYRGHIRKVPSSKLAVLVVYYVFSHLCAINRKGRLINSMCSNIGQLVHTEIISIMAAEVSKTYMQRVDAAIVKDNVTSTRDLKRRIRWAANALHLDVENWTQAEQFGVGKLLVEIVHNQGIFNWKYCRDGVYAEADEEIKKYIEGLVNNATHLQRIPPMVVPPTRHEDMFNGGHLTDVCHKLTVSNRRATRADKRRINESFKEATVLRDALNKTQEVPYCVNNDVLYWVTEAQRVGFAEGMPSTKEIKAPEFPKSLEGKDKDTWNEADKELFSEWKAMARLALDDEHKRRSLIISLNTTLSLCRTFKDEPVLYFPTCLDWRGRIYFKPHLNLQGTGVQKALLRFSKRKPLGERGFMWLKAHVACCFGYDKYLPEVCAKWTEDRITLIRAFVENPLDAMGDDKPDDFWGMLAASIELIKAIDSGDPHSYESFIAVSRDATNSVGQHYSAMMRDPVGGLLTNLIHDGGDTKADLYMKVKANLDKILQEIVDQRGDNLVEAEYWLRNPVTRSMTKKPTMTYFYSSTHRSRTKYLLEGAQEEGYEGEDGYSLFKLCSFLATPMSQAIKATLPAAVAAMDYIKALIALIPQEECLEFETALGLLVVHRYPKTTDKKVWVSSMGIHNTTVKEVHWGVSNCRKSATAGSPNMIHQSDAAHLGLIIANADCQVWPIHDQVATHACDVDHLNVVVREQFVNLFENYKNPIELLEDYLDKLGVDYSELERPEVGSLDLKEVLKSPFFFC